MRAVLALEDGNYFEGEGFGAEGRREGEVCFNTSMTGYQEIFTDPSYTQQIITLTYPHIGNVGVNDQDNESSKIYASGIVIRSLSPIASNFRHQKSLQDFLIEQGVVGISEIDTRHLTTHLREFGAQSGVIAAGTLGQSTESLLDLAKQSSNLFLACQVSI